MLRGQTELEFTSNFGLTPTKDADYRFDLRRGHPGSEIADSAVELQIGQQRVVVGVVEVVLLAQDAQGLGSLLPRLDHEQ